MAACLGYPDPQVRETAAWALSRVGRADLVTARTEQRSDDGAVDLYEEGQLARTSVGAVSRSVA